MENAQQFDSHEDTPPGGSELSTLKGPNLFALDGIQLALHSALAQKEQKLSDIYFGALYALTVDGNPERFSQAAQSLRELVQALWVEYDETFKKKDAGLKPKVRALQRTCKSIRCPNGKTIHVRDISLEKLESFFKELEALFTWNDKFLPNRREQDSRAIAKMDPMIGSLPDAIMDLRVKELHVLREYFEDVAHHRKQPTSYEQFKGYVGALEHFLMDRLRPRTAEDFAELDKLIQEGERNA